MAGDSKVENGRLPKRSRNAAQPATTPGTVTLYTPRAGSSVMPCAFRNPGVIPAGAHPLAFSPCSLPVLASWTMAKRSPPMPLPVGSITPTTAFAAIAASTAFPPRCKTCTPAIDASGWLLATTPYRVAMTERPALGRAEPAGVPNEPVFWPVGVEATLEPMRAELLTNTSSSANRNRKQK